MKKILQKKNIIILLVSMFIICLTCAVIPQFKVKADDTVTETLEQKIVRFTDSDLLDGETEGGVNIRDFAKKYKKGEYRPTGYGSQDNYEVTGIIGKVIPIELLYTRVLIFISGMNTVLLYIHTLIITGNRIFQRF